MEAVHKSDEEFEEYSKFLKQKEEEIKNMNQMQLFELVQDIQNRDPSKNRISTNSYCGPLALEEGSNFSFHVAALSSFCKLFIVRINIYIYIRYLNSINCKCTLWCSKL
jgi:hypothetical protein